MDNLENTQIILDKIKTYLYNKNINFDYTILNAVEKRSQGKEFSLSEHVRGMILSLLSSQTKWSKIKNNLIYIEDLFSNYNVEEIKKQLQNNKDYYLEGLKKIKCSSQNRKEQINALYENIELLEKIAKRYASIDNYIKSQKIIHIILDLSMGQYKLRQMGIPLVCEYLRNVGFNIIKPDRHTRKILGLERLAFSNNKIATDVEALNIAEEMENKSTYSQVEIDFLLWHFCADGYGEICTTVNPKCKICPVKEFCNY